MGNMGNFTKSTPQDFETHNCGWSSLPPLQKKVNINLLFWWTNLFKLCPMFVPNLVKIGQKLWPLECKRTGCPTTLLPQQHNFLTTLTLWLHFKCIFMTLKTRSYTKGVYIQISTFPQQPPVWWQNFKKYFRLPQKKFPKLVQHWVF